MRLEHRCATPLPLGSNGIENDGMVNLISVFCFIAKKNTTQIGQSRNLSHGRGYFGNQSDVSGTASPHPYPHWSSRMAMSVGKLAKFLATGNSGPSGGTWG